MSNPILTWQEQKLLIMSELAPYENGGFRKSDPTLAKLRKAIVELTKLYVEKAKVNPAVKTEQRWQIGVGLLLNAEQQLKSGHTEEDTTYAVFCSAEKLSEYGVQVWPAFVHYMADRMIQEAFEEVQKKAGR